MKRDHVGVGKCKCLGAHLLNLVFEAFCYELQDGTMRARVFRAVFLKYAFYLLNYLTDSLFTIGPCPSKD